MKFIDFVMYGFILFSMVVSWEEFVRLMNANITNNNLLFIFPFVYIMGMFYCVLKTLQSLFVES